MRVIHRLLESGERRMDRALLSEFNTVVENAASNYPRWEVVIPQHEKRLGKIFLKEMLRTASAATQRAREATKFHLPHLESKLLSEDELRAMTARWVRKHAAKKVSEVAKTTKTRIANAIERGVDEDQTTAQIARRIRDEVGGMSRSRARTIARTETHAAVGSSQQIEMTAVAEENDLKLKKTWTSTEDDTTRETHIEADGQTVDLDDTFTVGDDELLFPGDPDGSPEEVINCRCIAIYGT